MKFKTLLKLLIVALIAGIAAFVVIDRYRNDLKRNAAAAVGDFMLPGLEMNKVSAIFIRSPRGETRLFRTPEGRWRVEERGDYFARTDLVGGLLYALANARVVETMTVPKNQLERLGLVLPPVQITPDSEPTLLERQESPISVEIFDANAQPLVPTLVAGAPIYPAVSENPTLELLSRHYLVARNPYDVYLSSQTLVGVSALPQTWLDKSFPRIGDIAAIALDFSDSARSWRMARTDPAERFMLLNHADTGIFDSENADTASFFLQALNFEDVRPHQEVANALKLEVVTFDGLARRFTFADTGDRTLWVHMVIFKDGKPDPDYGGYAEWDYLITRHQFARLLKAKSDWLLNPESTFFGAPAEL